MLPYRFACQEGKVLLKGIFKRLLRIPCEVAIAESEHTLYLGIIQGYGFNDQRSSHRRQAFGQLGKRHIIPEYQVVHQCQRQHPIRRTSLKERHPLLPQPSDVRTGIRQDRTPMAARAHRRSSARRGTPVRWCHNRYPWRWSASVCGSQPAEDAGIRSQIPYDLRMRLLKGRNRELQFVRKRRGGVIRLIIVIPPGRSGRLPAQPTHRRLQTVGPAPATPAGSRPGRGDVLVAEHARGHHEGENLPIWHPHGAAAPCFPPVRCRARRETWHGGADA